MRILIIFLFLCFLQNGHTQVVLKADGPGDTYDLISSVLAPGQNPIETPDCGHNAFGDHIDEIFDEELNDFVFRFHLHTEPDNDRCISFDRQRNEIKSYAPSPDNLLGIEEETVVYKWKFKLPEGFQSSPNFTHLHQLKSVGGDLASMPIYTLTARKSSPDRLELRYAETTNQTTLIQTDLAPFIGRWVEVTETIKYGYDGTYEIEIIALNDETVLLSYENNSIINWRPGGDFVRPKWGIYRSLNNAQDLRDEMVLFADFSVEELDLVDTNEPEMQDDFSVYFNSINKSLHLKNIDRKTKAIQVFSWSGRKIMDIENDQVTELNLDVSTYTNGLYIISLKGEGSIQSKSVLIFN